MTLGKTELTQKVAENCGYDLPKRQIEAIVKTVFEQIKTAVNNGDRVTIQEFGRFEATEHKERVMNNSFTNGEKTIPAKHKPVLRVSDAWSDACDAAHK